MSDDDPVVLQSITVTRTLQPWGEETYRIDTVGEVGWLEGLGLLEAAKFDLYERFNGRWEGDEDDE